MPRIGALLVIAVLTLAACDGTPVPDGVATPGPSAGPTLSSSPSPVAVASPEPLPTASPAPSGNPGPADPTPGPKPRFRAGDVVQTITDDLRVRSLPKVSGDSVRHTPLLERGTYARILRGPVKGSGYWWYRVRVLSGVTLDGGITRGWIVAADHDGEPWIELVVDTDEVPEPDMTGFPVPVLRFDGTEERTDPDGTAYVAYILAVTNWDEFDPAVFSLAPDLEPCGRNQDASRTWVDIIDADAEQRLSGFCGLDSPDDLLGIWFAVKQGDPAPSSVYVQLTDRQETRMVESNVVHLDDR